MVYLMQTLWPMFEFLDPGVQPTKFCVYVLTHFFLVFSIDILYMFDHVHGTWTVAAGPATDLLDELQILDIVKHLIVKAIHQVRHLKKGNTH